MNRLMLVDDEENVLRALARLIQRSEALRPLELESFCDPLAAMRRLSEAPFDVVVSDYRMPLADGVAVLSHARAEQPDTVRLILSAQADMGALVRAINDAQIFRFLGKPWDDRVLVDSFVEAFQEHARLVKERQLADAQRMQTREITVEEHARRQIEREAPGITKVRWGPNGEVLLDDD